MRATANSIAEPNLELALQQIAVDLRTLVAKLNRPRPGDGQWRHQVRERCVELNERLSQIKEQWTAKREALPQAFADLKVSLQKYASERKVHYNTPRIKEMQANLAQRYEDAVAQLRAMKQWSAEAGQKLRDVRLPKAARSIFHVFMGLSALTIYELWMPWHIAVMVLGSLAVIASSMEISRRFSPRFNDFMVDKLFGLISRPRERYQTNSATYYLLALTIITFLAPKTAVGLGVLVLAIGDPIASALGSRYGRIRLANDKSLIGSLAFFSSATLACFAYLMMVSSMSYLGALGLAAAVAGIGAVVELFADKIDDNFSIPMACALSATLMIL